MKKKNLNKTLPKKKKKIKRVWLTFFSLPLYPTHQLINLKKKKTINVGLYTNTIISYHTLTS